MATPTDLQPVDAGLSVRQEFGASEIMRAAEVSMAAMAAQQKAIVEARFVMAMKIPRKWLDVRSRLMELCKNPDFAAEALYVKPLSATPDTWKKMSKRERLQSAPEEWPTGFSIRFIEAALFEAGNFYTDTMILWEDSSKRMTQVSVMDLERNSSYSRTVTTARTVERSYLKRGEEEISKRYNTEGKIVYLLQASEADVTQKEASGVSKSIRTLGERLLPPHYKMEWRRQIEETIFDAAAKDPEGEKKKLMDGFASKGVMPSDLEALLEHNLDACTPAELLSLRTIWVAITNGEATWKEVMESKFGPANEEAGESEGAKKIREKLQARRTAQPPQPAKPEAAAQPEKPAEAKPAAELPAWNTLPNHETWPEQPEHHLHGLRIMVAGKYYQRADDMESWKPAFEQSPPAGKPAFGQPPPKGGKR
jgi:hypothetical protein